MEAINTEKRKKRLKFMEAAYQEVEGSGRAPFSVLPIGEKLGFGIEETFDIANYLYGEGLLRSTTVSRPGQ